MKILRDGKEVTLVDFGADQPRPQLARRVVDEINKSTKSLCVT